MKKFNNTDGLTGKDWEEVFVYPKEFKKGDIVENSSAGGSDGGHVWVVVGKTSVIGMSYDDIVYELENINTKVHGFASSTMINIIGTFIDDDIRNNLTNEN